MLNYAEYPEPFTRAPFRGEVFEDAYANLYLCIGDEFVNGDWVELALELPSLHGIAEFEDLQGPFSVVGSMNGD